MTASPLHWQLGAVASAAARAGGAAALVHFRDPRLGVEWKPDASPVTRADREAEAAIRSVVAAALPGDCWLGEETGEAVLGGGQAPPVGTPYRRWIVDPVDGTRNFVRGVPLWATLVACEEVTAKGSRVVAAAVGIPALDEWYDAVVGGGARCNGTPIRVSTVERLDQALWCFETPGKWWDRAGIAGVFSELVGTVALARGLSDAYGHMLVASGRAELMIEPALSIWDVAATSLVVTEAGGRFSDLAGSPSIDSKNAVVSNGCVHDAALDLIRRQRPTGAPAGTASA